MAVWELMMALLAADDKWHVMVSSTMSDLVEEREIAATAIAEAGMQPWRAEEPLVRLLGLSPERFCQRMAEECDLYLLILGDRYGFIPDGQAPGDELSVTHLEYRWARNANQRKVLVFISSGALNTSDRRQLAFIEEVQDFHKGYLRPRPFGSVQDLYQQVVEALKQWRFAETRGMLKYLQYSLETYGFYDDPITKTKAPIQSTVPMLLRAFDVESIIPDDWRAARTSRSSLAAIDLVTRVLEDFVEGDEVETFRRTMETHQDLVSQSIEDLVAQGATLFRSGFLEAARRMPTNETEAKNEEADLLDLIGESLAHDLSQKPPTVDTADQLLNEFRHLLLVGDPGAGKSILVRQLAYNSASRALDAPELPHVTVPLCIEAEKLSELLAANSSCTIFDLIGLISQGIPEADLALSAALTRGTLMLLVDGLDEVMEENQREAVLSFVQKEAANIRALITLRPVILSQVSLPAWRLCRVEPLKSSTRLALAHSVIQRFAGADVASTSVQDLERILESRQDIRAWSANPLLLTLIAVEYARERSIPVSRAELYQHAFERLVDVDERQDPSVQRLSRLEIQTALCRMALAMMERGVTLISRNEIGAYAASSQTEALSDDTVKEILDRSSILQPRGGYRWGFIHLSFQEYCAAAQLATWSLEESREFIVRRRFSSRWEHVSKLFVDELDLLGRSRDADIVIGALIEVDGRRVRALRGHDPLHLSLVRAARCQRDRIQTQDEGGPYDALVRRWVRIWRASKRNASRSYLLVSVTDAIGSDLLPELRRDARHMLRISGCFRRIVRWLAVSILYLLVFLAILVAQAVILIHRFLPSHIHIPSLWASLAQLTSSTLLGFGTLYILVRVVRSIRRPRQPLPHSWESLWAMSRLWPESASLFGEAFSGFLYDIARYLHRTSRTSKLAIRVVPKWQKKRNSRLWQSLKWVVTYFPAAEEVAKAIGAISPWLFRRLASTEDELPAELIASIRSPNPLVRAASLYLVGLSGAVARPAIPEVVAALADEDYVVRVIAARAVGKLGPDAAIALRSLVNEITSIGRMSGDTTETQPGTRDAVDSASDGNLLASLLEIFDYTYPARADLVAAVARALAALGPTAAPALPDLLTVLGTEDAATQSAIVAAIGHMGSPASDAIPDLVNLTKDGDDSVVDAAFTALGNLGPVAENALPTLLEYLRSGDSMYQKRAMQVIARLGKASRPALSDLVTALTSANDDVARTAFQALISLGADAAPAVPDLVQLLRSGEKPHRLRILAMIATLGELDLSPKSLLSIAPEILEALPILVADLPTIIRWLVELGRNIPDAADLAQSVEHELSDGTKDGDVDNGMRVKEALENKLPVEKKSTPSGVSLAEVSMSLLSGGPMPESVTNFLESVVRKWTGLEPILHEIAHLLTDEDPAIADAATETLCALGPLAFEVVSDVRSVLATGTIEQSTMAVAVLKHIGVFAGADAGDVARVLSEGDRDAKIQAAAVLAHLGVQSLPALPSLRQAISQEGDVVLRAKAIDAIGAIGPIAIEVLPDLIQFASSDAVIVRNASFRAIGRIGRTNADAVAFLVQSLADANKESAPVIVGALRGTGNALARHAIYLRKLANRKRLGVRRQILDLLSSELPSDAQEVNIYVRALRDNDPLVRNTAMRALARIEGTASKGISGILSLVQSRFHRALHVLEVILTCIIGALLLAITVEQLLAAFPGFASRMGQTIPVLHFAITTLRGHSGYLWFLVSALSILLAWAAIVVIQTYRGIRRYSSEAAQVLLSPMEIRIIALNTLARMGHAAAPALPKVARAVHDESLMVSRAAASALRSIIGGLDEVG